MARFAHSRFVSSVAQWLSLFCRIPFARQTLSRSILRALRQADSPVEAQRQKQTRHGGYKISDAIYSRRFASVRFLRSEANRRSLETEPNVARGSLGSYHLSPLYLFTARLASALQPRTGPSGDNSPNARPCPPRVVTAGPSLSGPIGATGRGRHRRPAGRDSAQMPLPAQAAAIPSPDHCLIDSRTARSGWPSRAVRSAASQ